MGETGKQDMEPDEVVAHLILNRSQYAARTWRFHKSATIYYLETFFPHHETAIEELRRQTSAGLRGGGVNTSSRKRKSVPESEWVEIRHAITQRIKSGYKNAAGLLAVLEATLLTGLRPVEWALAELAHHADDGRRVLRVKNAKHTNGRANGAYREMYVDQLTEGEVATIARAIAAFDSVDDDQAARLQIAYKHELEAARAVAVAGKRRPQSSVTLYSFRHQFIANAKLTFADPVITAALSGHYSTKTAHRHYGKRRNGRSAVRVYPTESSVAAVQNRYLETYRDFVAQRGAEIAPSPNPNSH
ncbi:hypothetical protein R70006_04982 [Paraburkholderia domus]|uniref:hypothetical protein n=1 Tax=Paraburkholderia domus TaxID=2793075 RepID=UPI001B207F32|nr:hypothetical protein [Paraburkholderia domus]CAE6793972.1 hypothetical protein R70006_04982 [Paraburkholderia domus]